MPAFAYTTGNPNNLTAGANASMADIQGPFTDLRTAINGSLDETNVPNLSAAFTTYKEIARGGAQTTNTVTNVVTLLAGGVVATNVSNPIVNSGNASPADVALYLDPTAFTANTRTTKLRIRYVVFTNSTAPAITYTVGLYPIATYGGGYVHVWRTPYDAPSRRAGSPAWFAGSSSPTCRGNVPRFG